MTEGASPLVSPATRRYVLGVSLLGVPILAASLYALAADLVAGRWPTPAQGLLAAFLGAAAYFVLRSLILFDWRGQRVALAPDEVLVFIALVALPTPLVILFAVPAMTAFQVATKRDLTRGSFNVGVLLLATAAGAEAFLLATGPLGLPPALGALIGIAVYTPVNLFIVAVVFAAREGAGVFTVYRERFFFPTLLHFGLGSSMGLALVALWSYHPAAVLALLPLVAFARAHVQLVARTDRESVVHRRLAEVSHALVGEPSEDVVAQRVVETCGDIFHAGRVTLVVANPDGTPHTWRRDGHGGFDPRRHALAEVLPGRSDALLGAITIHPTRDTREEFTPADRALLRVVAGEAAASLEHARALKDLDASRREILSTRVSRPLVKRIVRALVETTRADYAILLRLGQMLAREAEGEDVVTLCRAYEETGLGVLAFDERRGNQYFFEGRDLFERAPGATSTTCHLALGFLTGVVSRLHDGAQAVGTEVACESRGARACRFVVQVRTGG